MTTATASVQRVNRMYTLQHSFASVTSALLERAKQNVSFVANQGHPTRTTVLSVLD